LHTVSRLSRGRVHWSRGGRGDVARALMALVLGQTARFLSVCLSSSATPPGKPGTG